MGKFINTEHREMIDAMTHGVVKDMVKNPYYLFENTKATPVIFYELCPEATTLDDSTRLEYEQIGKESPLRFKKIEGVYLYGLQRMEIHYSSGESGLEADPINGDCTDLPNTINPTPGCYFEIPYLNEDQKHYLFAITDVSDDTMDDGNNIHRMTYELDMTYKQAWEDLQKQVVEEYVFIPGSVGTQKNSIILSSTAQLAEQLDDIDTLLRQYYNELFYNPRVQTFTVKYTESIRINDSMLIEFLIRTKIMNANGSEYIYVSHKRPVPRTFSIDYAKSVFNCIEKADGNNLPTAYRDGQYRIIDNMATIFESRQEPYYYVDYNMVLPPASLANHIETFDSDFLRRIYDNELYDYNSDDAYLNIVIKFMNGLTPVTSDDALALERVEYNATVKLYYTLPLVIYCLEAYIKSLIGEHKDN